MAQQSQLERHPSPASPPDKNSLIGTLSKGPWGREVHSLSDYVVHPSVITLLYPFGILESLNPSSEGPDPPHSSPLPPYLSLPWVTPALPLGALPQDIKFPFSLFWKHPLVSAKEASLTNWEVSDRFLSPSYSNRGFPRPPKGILSQRRRLQDHQLPTGSPAWIQRPPPPPSGVFCC